MARASEEGVKTHKEMEEIAARISEVLNQNLPTGLLCALVLYNGENVILTLGNTHPKNVLLILRKSLELTEEQVRMMDAPRPANDN